jgi:ABC-type transporter Mla subunit MlaD
MIGAELSELKQNFAPAAEHSQKLTPDAATILSQLARQAQKIYRNAGVMLRKF